MSLELGLSLAALFIAFLGGIPGIIQLIEHRRNRSTLIVHLDGMITGELQAQHQEGSFFAVFLAVTVLTKGALPVIPTHYRLTARCGRKRLEFTSTVIPPGMKLFRAEDDALFFDETNVLDLAQDKNPITRERAAVGFLMFRNETTTTDEFRKGFEHDLHLAIERADGRVDKVRFKEFRGRAANPVLPRHGMVRPMPRN